MAGDLYFNSVTASLHGDASPIADVKGHNLIVGSSVTVDTSNKVFGSGSLNFDGTSNAKIYCAHSDFSFGTGDLTVEFWISPNANPGSGNKRLIYTNATTNATTNYFKLWLYGGATLPSIYFEFNGAYRITTPALNLNVFYFVQLIRAGGVWVINVDGVQTGTYSSGNNLTDSALAVGYDPVWNNGYLNAKLDDIRVTKGVARANTVPSEAFPDNFGDTLSASGTVIAGAALTGYSSSVKPALGDILAVSAAAAEGESIAGAVAKAKAQALLTARTGCTQPVKAISIARATLRGVSQSVVGGMGTVLTSGLHAAFDAASVTPAVGTVNTVTGNPAWLSGGVAATVAVGESGALIVAKVGGICSTRGVVDATAIAFGNSYTLVGQVPSISTGEMYVKYSTRPIYVM